MDDQPCTSYPTAYESSTLGSVYKGWDDPSLVCGEYTGWYEPSLVP
jgi:hypothetical protein